jgi:hypothetical protein
MKHIPLAGDLLGLVTTTSINNGELTFFRIEIKAALFSAA